MRVGGGYLTEEGQGSQEGQHLANAWLMSSKWSITTMKEEEELVTSLEVWGAAGGWVVGEMGPGEEAGALGGWCWIAAVVCRAAFPKLGQSLQPFRALLKNKKSRAPPQTYPNRIHILKNLPTRFWDTPLKTAALTQVGRIERARFCDSFLVEGETEERKKMRSFLWVR